MRAARPSSLAFLLIACGTAIGIAGTDLVLPAIPSLPSALGGTAQQAQLVLAAFTAGAAIGLLLFGELGARFDQRRLLVLSLLAYGLVSLLCVFSDSLAMLIVLRLLQGAAGSAAAVFAPGMLRTIFGEAGAVRALGALGSVEALAPALAPVVGIWLLSLGGWELSFEVIAAASILLAALVAWRRDLLPARQTAERTGSYRSLFRNRKFLGHALGYAFTLGALLVFVFGAPTVFIRSLGLDLGAFIALQLSGIALFAVAANLAGWLANRFGAKRVIWTGASLSAAGTVAMLVYALSGGTNLVVIILLFTFVNGGLGLRGPPGFHAAIMAARGDDARASALVVLFILGIAAAGTALVAPFILSGLVAIAAGAAILALAGLFALLLPRDRGPGDIQASKSRARGTTGSSFRTE